MRRRLEETLPQSKRREFGLSGVNPVGAIVLQPLQHALCCNFLPSGVRSVLASARLLRPPQGWVISLTIVGAAWPARVPAVVPWVRDPATL